MQTAVVEGQTVRIGDWVGFKSDVEQSGRIVKISGGQLTLENDNGFDGGYIGGSTITTQSTDDCWVE